jgi:broad specificity phosphatase PhoE
MPGGSRGKTMTEIILARHGETEWNVATIFRGRMDVELNETGIREAELLAEYLSDRDIDAIYSSPLKRASRTAEIMAKPHTLKVETTPSLIDLDFGKWQGLQATEVKAKYKDLYATWLANPQQVQMPDGESLDDVRERAIGVVNTLITKDEGIITLVSHRVVNKVLICALLGLDNSHFWNIRLDTGGITTFTYDNGQFILTKHNDTSFLKIMDKATSSDF